MQALSGQHLTFTTLPSVPGSSQLLPGYGPNPQSVNIISVPYIQRLVHAAFYPAPAAPKTKSTAPAKKTAPVPPASTVTVDVYNGAVRRRAGRRRLPGARLPGLQGRGGRGRVGPVADRRRPAARCSTARARRPTRPRSRPTSAPPPRRSSTLPAGHVEVLTGSTVTAVPAASHPAGSSRREQPEPVGHADGAGRLGVRRGHLTVGPNAKYGIPCVLDHPAMKPIATGRWQRAPSYRPER